MSPIVTGVEATVRAQGEFTGKLKRAIADSLDLCADLVLEEASRLCPKDTLALVKTGRKEVTGSGFNAEATVAFGDPDNGVDYAWVVHEDPTAYHEPPTQAHYLGQAVRNRRGAMTRTVQRQVRVVVGGTGGEYVE